MEHNYFTSKNSLYPLPENSTNFEDIKIPSPLPAPKLTAENKETMQERETVNGKAVRKRTVHQETTITKAGALLESFYRQELKSTDANEEIECNSDDPENNEIKI